MVGVREVPDRAWQVHIIAPENGEKLVHVDILDHYFHHIIGSKDGDMLLTTKNWKTVDGATTVEGNISTYDFDGGGKLSPLVVERIPTELRLAHDGSLLGVIATGERRLGNKNDHEIVRLDTRNGAIHRLTKNPLRDGLPRPALKAPVYIYSCRPWTAGRERSVCVGMLPDLEPLESE